MPSNLKYRRGKPCPFCGCDERTLAENTANDGRTYVAVECTFCHARGPWRKTKEQARIEWDDVCDTVKEALDEA